MATKSKVTQHSDRGSHFAARRTTGSVGESTMEESETDQIVDEVPGSTESDEPTTFGTEFSESEKHSPEASPARRVESASIESAADTDPKVDASFGNLSSLHDDREFWDAVTRAIAPLVINTVKKTGTSLLKKGVKKISPSLASMLRLEGFNESAIQRLTSQQQESGADDQEADQQEFWGAIAGALVPVLTPYAKKLAGAAAKTGKSWAKRIFETSQQESSEGMEAFSQQLEDFFVEQASWNQQESGFVSSEDQREFWGALARKLAPVLSPVAKAVSGAAVSAGKSILTSGIKKLSPTLSNLLRREGFSESAIQRLESGKQESSEDAGSDQQEFWGVIASALVPVLMPHAKKLAGAAAKKGGSMIKRIFETSEQESGEEFDFMSQQLQGLFIAQATAGRESSGISNADQQEFWGALARKIVPVLAPVAKAAASKAVSAGASWVRGLFESQQEFSGDTESMSQQLEQFFIEEASASQGSTTGFSAEDQQEFWGGIARKLMPVLAPIAKNLAGAAVKTGKSMVTAGIRKLNPAIISLLRQEGISESAIAQIQNGRHESAPNGTPGDEREFWGSIARTLVPVLSPFAKKIGRTAISASGRLVAAGIKLAGIESGEDVSVASESAIQQIEAMEVIIDDDNREQVDTTTSVPFNRICHLSIKAADGSSFLGTGFFIGPRTIATAGHCVYQKDHGGWPQQIIVSPGRNGDDKPYGQFVATKFCSVKGWTENLDRDCDYGVIQLSKNDKVPAQIGCFGFGIFTDAALAAKQLNVTGYPGDKPSGTMMTHSQKAKAVTQTTITYDIDTVGGQSGSAVYDENRRAVAIHTNGASTGNSGTRITKSVFNNLVAWRAAAGA